MPKSASGINKEFPPSHAGFPQVVFQVAADTQPAFQPSPIRLIPHGDFGLPIGAMT